MYNLITFFNYSLCCIIIITMKYHLSKTDLDSFNHLIDIKDINMSVADMLNELYSDGFYVLSSDIDKDHEKDSIYENMMDYFQIDLDDSENAELGKKYFYDVINKLDIETYTSDEYHSLGIEEVKEGTLEVKYLSYQPYELFSLSDITVDPSDYSERSPIGYFDREYKYLALIDKGVIWMSVSPNEIETMKPLIKDVRGNVLIFGLGLGYLAFTLSIREEVKKITIIENNLDVIKLFKENILPHFKYKNKIEILYKDAFIYLGEEMKKAKYEFALIDIYHDANEALPLYMRFIRYEEIYKNTEFRYWLHTSITALIRRHMLTLLYEEINKVDIDYTKSGNWEDRLINHLHFYLENREINSYKDIHDLLSDESILSIVHEIIK